MKTPNDSERTKRIWLGVLLGVLVITTISTAIVVFIWIKMSNTGASVASRTDGITPIDLAAYYDSSPQWTQGGEWADVPRGHQLLGGIPFEVSGMIKIIGEGSRKDQRTYREQVEGIIVGKKFDRLHLLHTAHYPAADGTPYARIVLRYADGSTATLPLLFGRHARDWWRADPETRSALSDPNSEVVWRGGDAGIKPGRTRRIFKTTFTNPKPEQEVNTIDVLSHNTTPNATIFAMSVGPAPVVGTHEQKATFERAPDAREDDYTRADSISITLGNSVVERGLRLLTTPDDGATTPEAIDGVESHRLMQRGENYAYFAVDPSWKITNRFDVFAEVEYFDAARGWMDVEYDGWGRRPTDGRYSSTPRRVSFSGQREWRTNLFWMPDVRFENRQKEGADLRVRASSRDFYLRSVILRRDVPGTNGPYANAHSISITFSSNLVSEGVILAHARDSVKSPTNALGKECYVVRPGSTGAGYLYLAVDRSFKASHLGPCAVEVEYYSPRPGSLRVEYDGEDNGVPSRHKTTAMLPNATGVWATNVFEVTSPRFRNAQNEEADFRVNTFGNQMFFRKVTVRTRE